MAPNNEDTDLWDFLPKFVDNRHQIKVQLPVDLLADLDRFVSENKGDLPEIGSRSKTVEYSVRLLLAAWPRLTGRRPN